MNTTTGMTEPWDTALIANSHVSSQAVASMSVTPERKAEELQNIQGPG